MVLRDQDENILPSNRMIKIGAFVGVIVLSLVLVYNGLSVTKVEREEILGLNVLSEVSRSDVELLEKELQGFENRVKQSIQEFSKGISYQTVSHSEPHDSSGKLTSKPLITFRHNHPNLIFLFKHGNGMSLTSM
jgi:hypothetical protein